MLVLVLVLVLGSPAYELGSPEQVAADAHRDAELVRLHGVRVVRFDAALVVAQPAAVVAHILALVW